MNKIVIYTKVCLPCVMKENWKELQRTMLAAGYEAKVVRTTYDTSAHKEATELWGSDNYVAFAIMPNGEAVAVGKAKKMFGEIKDKMIKPGKTKPVRKGKKHVQGLRQAKNHKRPIRVSAVEDTPVEVKVENKSRQKIQVKES